MFDRVVERNIDDDVFDAIKNDRKRSRVLITINSRLSSKKKLRVSVNRSFCSDLALESLIKKKKENEKKSDEKEKREKEKEKEKEKEDEKKEKEKKDEKKKKKKKKRRKKRKRKRKRTKRKKTLI